MKLVEDEGYVSHSDVQVRYDFGIGCNVCTEDCGIVGECYDACVVGMVDGYDDVASAGQSAGK
jgi:Pyruvate/2-oxoacid:ferredoxin oxidoreductase delta subunit